MDKGEINVIVSSQEQYFDKVIESAREFSNNYGITCFVSVNKLYSSLIKDFKEAGINSNKFLFVDAVTMSINPKVSPAKNCFFVNSPSDLTNLSILINHILASDKINRLIFDSISTLLIYNKGNVSYKFVHSLVNKLKQSNKAAVLMVSEGETTSQILDEVSMYVDNVINTIEKKAGGQSVQNGQKDLELIYLASHEMRTPLTSIVSLLPLVSKEKLGKLNDKQKETLGIIYCDARRLALLIDNMVSATEIDRGLIISRTDRFNVKDLVSEVIDSLKFMFDSKKMNLKIDIQESLIVKADKNRLKQALSNVIMNAIKYANNEGNIVITGKRENYNILIEVKDDGEGISKKELPKIFNKPDISMRKYLPEKNHETSLSGIGYGLYIARKIIEAHKGKMWAESESGKGAAFYMLFPAEQNA